MSVFLAFVTGVPRPQGSKVGYYRGGRVVLVESGGVEHKAWRNEVAKVAQEEWTNEPMSGALQASLTFYLPKPKKRTSPPTSKPDIDKLARAVLDSLSKIVYRDDAQITMLTVRKRWAGSIRAGVTILVAPDNFATEKETE